MVKDQPKWLSHPLLFLSPVFLFRNSHKYLLANLTTCINTDSPKLAANNLPQGTYSCVPAAMSIAVNREIGVRETAKLLPYKTLQRLQQH